MIRKALFAVLLLCGAAASAQNGSSNGDLTSSRPNAGGEPDEITVRLGLLDISGRRVMDLSPGSNDIRHLRPGVYFVRREDVEQTTKVILTR